MVIVSLKCGDEDPSVHLVWTRSMEGHMMDKMENPKDKSYYDALKLMDGMSDACTLMSHVYHDASKNNDLETMDKCSNMIEELSGLLGKAKDIVVKTGGKDRLEKNSKDRESGVFLEHRFTDGEFKDIAGSNFDSFYDLREALVRKRQSTCTIEQMANELKMTPDELLEGLESYYSDPTLSELQTYALALGMKIHVEVEDCEDNKLDEDQVDGASRPDGQKSFYNRLLEFDRIVNEKIADGDFDDLMTVVDDEGSFPVVTMLSDEPLSMLEERCRAIGGKANVFISDDGKVLYTAVDLLE